LIPANSIFYNPALAGGESTHFDRLRRRDFITLLGGVAAWPLSARAQQPKMSVIGYLGPGSAAASASTLAVFRQSLAGTGYVEGRNIAIEYRFAEGRCDRLPEMAAELVRQQVSLIVATGDTAPALAAKAATATLPIVFSVTDDPVALGLVVRRGDILARCRR
jgi:putative tryptophan/tyrosine transport system substrate-binding protein